MDGIPIDQGKLVSPGYINADPPGEPFFALTVGEGGVANSIAQAGGSVTVDAFGGINMIANSGSFVGIDSFANITIEAVGEAGFVGIENAGVIAFSVTGVGALTGVQTINGSAYPPAVGSLPATASFSTITLGTGGYLTTSENTGYIVSKTFEGLSGEDTVFQGASGQTLYINGGTGGTENAIMQLYTDGTILINNVNAGGLTDATGLTIGAEGRSLTFPLDPTSAFGVGALTNISTINSAAYPPPAPVLTTGITTDLTLETWTQVPMSSIYYFDYDLGTPVTSATNVQCTTINSHSDTASSCWLVNVTPDEAVDGTLRFYCAADPASFTATGPLYISWLITNP